MGPVLDIEISRERGEFRRTPPRRIRGIARETGGARQSNQLSASRVARHLVRGLMPWAAQIRVGGVKLMQRIHLVNDFHGA
jgi:hypothetical protein